MPRRPANPVLILILGALTTISPLAIDLYLAAFPRIAAELNSSVNKVALSLSSYFIGMAAGQLFYGPVLDRFGRKRPLYFGLTLFALSSLGCLYSHSVEALIAFRFLQALGGCVAGVGATAMVRDFFPVAEGAKVFSLLMLVLSVSPLLAPTLGGFLSVQFGWHSVFVFLLAAALVMLAVTYFFLPEGHEPDPGISLRPLPILREYFRILVEPHFSTYALSGALSFAGLFVYVAGSPIIFMEIFRVSPELYGGIFAMLSVGFIGAGQVNILLSRRFTARQIYARALLAQVGLGGLFLLLGLLGLLTLPLTVALLFSYLSTLGFLYPNAAALALAPFSRNAGSASALLGFLQIGAGAVASTGIGLFEGASLLPVISLYALTPVLSSVAYLLGQRRLRGATHAAVVPAAPLH